MCDGSCCRSWLERSGHPGEGARSSGHDRPGARAATLPLAIDRVRTGALSCLRRRLHDAGQPSEPRVTTFSGVGGTADARRPRSQVPGRATRACFLSTSSSGWPERQSLAVLRLGGKGPAGPARVRLGHNRGLKRRLGTPKMCSSLQREARHDSPAQRAHRIASRSRPACAAVLRDGLPPRRSHRSALTRARLLSGQV